MSESKMDSEEYILKLLNEIKYFENLAKANLESLQYMKKGTVGVIYGLQSHCNEIKSRIDEIININIITNEYKVKLVELTARKLVENIDQAKNKHALILTGIENLKKEHENYRNKDESKKVKICDSQEISKYLEEVENLINDCIDCCKSIKNTSDTRDEYDPPTLTKPAYVVMFVNLKFQDQNPLDLQPDITAVEKAFKSEHGFHLQNINDYRNLNGEETLEKIKQLKNTDFGQYSCLIIIYDSHGTNYGKLIAADNESVEITKFWEACDGNTTLLNKPIIIIIETCRGKNYDRTNASTCAVTKSTAFHRFHPEKHNFLIVFATSDGQIQYRINTLIFISHGFQLDSDIHREIIPSLQQTYSYINSPVLTGMPKVFLNLGTNFGQPKKQDKPFTTEKTFHGSLSIVTENSDILSYCDRAEGWCQAICDVIEKSPGNPDGLVRLLTEAMRRPKALASKYPPHIQSSLRFKLVFPSQKK